MKNRIQILCCLLAALLMACPGMAGESQLTGKLLKTPKSHSPYRLELDGKTGALDLRGEILKNVPEGARIWVRGEIQTALFDSGAAQQPSPWPTTWQVFMDVKDCRKIGKRFEIPKDVERDAGGQCNRSNEHTIESEESPSITSELRVGMTDAAVMAVLKEHELEMSGACGGTMAWSAMVNLPDHSKLTLDFKYQSRELRDKGPSSLVGWHTGDLEIFAFITADNTSGEGYLNLRITNRGNDEQTVLTENFTTISRGGWWITGSGRHTIPNISFSFRIMTMGTVGDPDEWKIIPSLPKLCPVTLRKGETATSGIKLDAEFMQAISKLGQAVRIRYTIGENLAERYGLWHGTIEIEKTAGALLQGEDSQQDAVQPAERVAAIQTEIQNIEDQCIPAKGSSRQDVEKIFGTGEPLHPTESKIPQEGTPPESSPRRAYHLCDNGTLIVRYDTERKVLHSSYINPYSIKGRPFGMTVTDEEVLQELAPRLDQMKRILAEYKKRKDGE